eukprot:12932189-Prorocentrum_lima.AAC.1
MATECPRALVSMIVAMCQSMRARSCSPPIPPAKRNVPGVKRRASATMWSSLAAEVQFGNNTNFRVVRPIVVVCRMTLTFQSGGNVFVLCIQMVAGSSRRGIC